jgi:hypothetical protein
LALEANMARQPGALSLFFFLSFFCTCFRMMPNFETVSMRPKSWAFHLCCPMRGGSGGDTVSRMNWGRIGR